MCDQQRLRTACVYAQSDQSLCWSLEYFISVKLLTIHHLEFLSLKGGGTDSSESIHVKMPHCWKSHVAAQTGKQLLSLNAISNEAKGEWSVSLSNNQLPYFVCEQECSYEHLLVTYGKHTKTELVLS